MFEHHGAERTHRQNVVLAGYLASIAGFVDAVGVVTLDRFTSHVTGTAVRTAAALSQTAAHPLGGLSMLGMFLVGAVLSSSLLESTMFSKSSHAYGTALCVEALLLLCTAIGSRPAWQIATLCCAMGLQNALVTRLSGAIVRTTHLTGVVTDIGIELGRWLRYWRVQRRRIAERPAAAKINLLASIASAFLVGATAGAFAAVSWQLRALFAPALLLGAGALTAFSRGRALRR